MMIFSKIKSKIRLLFLKYNWRIKHKHNNTYPKSYFPIQLVTIGRHTYGAIDIHYYGAENEKLIIGNFVSIANGVTFILGEHDSKSFFTFPLRTYLLREKRSEALCKGAIIINDDVWIGFNATILSGINVGKGAIIAAGSVVTKDVPPYSIVGGVPAKIIRLRFEKEIIDRLNKIDISKFSDSQIRTHIEQFYRPVTHELLDEIFHTMNISNSGLND